MIVLILDKRTYMHNHDKRTYMRNHSPRMSRWLCNSMIHARVVATR